jgi:hypothetical protein
MDLKQKDDLLSLKGHWNDLQGQNINQKKLLIILQLYEIQFEDYFHFTCTSFLNLHSNA